jgi:GNAT superfamily N-acetyltransferase
VNSNAEPGSAGLNLPPGVSNDISMTDIPQCTTAQDSGLAQGHTIWWNSTATWQAATRMGWDPSGKEQMMATPCHIRVESLADHPELVEQIGLLRWKEWAYGGQDSTHFVEVTAREAGRKGRLPMTLVAIDVAGGAVGAVGLDRVDDELSVAERAGRTPWIVGMVVAEESGKLGVGRQLLQNLQDVAACLDHPRTWVATGHEAVGFYQRCGWAAVEHLRLNSTGIPTIILAKPAKRSLVTGRTASTS